jgi:thermostable 8-oxoguanine DNA glycosylase
VRIADIAITTIPKSPTMAKGIFNVSKRLAVLDSRNLNFLKSLGIASEDLKASKLSNRRIYCDLEDLENEIADQLGVTVSELDERIMTCTSTSGELPHRI